MILSTAWLGLGYAALLVSVAAQVGSVVRRSRPARLVGQVLAVASVLLLWSGVLDRALEGHGWPFVSPGDTAAAIAMVMMTLYLAWVLATRERGAGLAVTAIALALLSYGIGSGSGISVTGPATSAGTLLSASFNLLGASCLALAAAISLTNLARAYLKPRLSSQARSTPVADSPASEVLVRGALFCLAVSLAIDTWWLQEVGLGSGNDAQQAGTAIAWVIYFGALRLRSSPRWRGWPWAAILTVGFACVLPILIKAQWLENTLPI
jgi:hypothetical protein